MNFQSLGQNWGAYAVCGLCISALVGLRLEIKIVENELRIVRSADAAAAAAVENSRKISWRNREPTRKRLSVHFPNKKRPGAETSIRG